MLADQRKETLLTLLVTTMLCSGTIMESWVMVRSFRCKFQPIVTRNSLKFTEAFSTKTEIDLTKETEGLNTGIWLDFLEGSNLLCSKILKKL